MTVRADMPKPLTDDEIFVQALLGSEEAANAVADHYRALGLFVTVLKIRVRPKFDQRAEYSDPGFDIVVGREGQRQYRVEVHRRQSLKFTSKKDFKFPWLLLDQCDKYKTKPFPEVFACTNQAMTHAGFVHTASRRHWFRRKSRSGLRAHQPPTECWFCPVKYVEFLPLLRP